ncbi:MAG: NAD(P)-dependent glycerol-3-phosphate dehydrogenase [Chloroflexi bacterium]|nr:NAD(P)-dependent glycerol-3-phosphate dehydrogenase [Chloroflexota bacterium]
MTTRVAIVGTTAWGSTLGILLASKGFDVKLCARTEAEAERLNRDRKNAAHLPYAVFPDSLRATASPGEAMANTDLVILAVPSQTMRENLRKLRPCIQHSALLLSVSKGVEIETTRRMSEVIGEEIGSAGGIAVLSGPNFAKEVTLSMPTATVVASADAGVAKAIQQMISTRYFRAYTNEDVIGVELGGALKNVIALAVGMSDGLGFGDNTRAALITRGLAEVTRLGVAAGAKPLTFSGLAGMGDLVATCTSQLSRNRYVGQELAGGRPLKEILSTMTGIAEGVTTTIAALTLAQNLHVEMPIAEQVHRVLFEGVSVKEAVPALMERELKQEVSPDIFG